MDGALGPIVFQGGLGNMNTFHAMSKMKKETYARHRVIQQVDLIEDTGADPIELSIQMHFHAPYTMAPGAAITQLESVMDMRTPLPLVIGSTPVGRGFLTLFVIEDLQSKMTKFSSSALIVGDIDVKLCEYAGSLALSGPLSALGGALPGLSGAVAQITGTLSSVAAAAGIATTASSTLSQFGAGAGIGTKKLGTLGSIGGNVGGVFGALSGASKANTIASLISNLAPGAVTQITAPSASMVQTAITNLRAAGH
jgi:hypothetical protein